MTTPLFIIEPPVTTEATRARLAAAAEHTGATLLPHGCEVPGIEPHGIYRDTDDRYRRDPNFCAAVRVLQGIAEEHGFTPGELRQIAFKAALNIEELRAGPISFRGIKFP